ncbi:MAG: twin-arginine translocation signal domain-containing protein [Holdemania massiliensis]
MAKKSISRRDFLKGAAASTLGLAAVGIIRRMQQ